MHRSPPPPAPPAGHFTLNAQSAPPPTRAPAPTWANPQSLNPANSHINSKPGPSPRGARQRFGRRIDRVILITPRVRIPRVRPSLWQRASGNGGRWRPVDLPVASAPAASSLCQFRARAGPGRPATPRVSEAFLGLDWENPEGGMQCTVHPLRRDLCGCGTVVTATRSRSRPGVAWVSGKQPLTCLTLRLRRCGGGGGDVWCHAVIREPWGGRRRWAGAGAGASGRALSRG